MTRRGKEKKIEKENLSFYNPVKKPDNFFSWLASVIKKRKKKYANIGNNKKILEDYSKALKREKNVSGKITHAENISSVKKDVVGSASKKSLLKKVNQSEDKWWAPSILNTNLIKGESTIIFDWKKNTSRLIISLSLSLLFIVVVYIALIYWGIKTQTVNTVLLGEVDILKTKVGSLEKETVKADVFQERLSIVNEMLSGHIHWDGFFSFFEKNIISGVSLPASFKGGVDGEYSFNVVVEDFETMLDQVNYLRSLEDVVSAKMDNVEIIQKQDAEDEVIKAGIKFRLFIKLNLEIFHS